MRTVARSTDWTVNWRLSRARPLFAVDLGLESVAQPAAKAAAVVVVAPRNWRLVIMMEKETVRKGRGTASVNQAGVPPVCPLSFDAGPALIWPTA